jgi:hypothetical protein
LFAAASTPPLGIDAKFDWRILMTVSEFERHVSESLASLPASVKDPTIPLPDRTLEALIHLNTEIHPYLKENIQQKLEISRMKPGPDKLRAAMVWNFFVTQMSPRDVARIAESIDEYINSATST